MKLHSGGLPVICKELLDRLHRRLMMANHTKHTNNLIHEKSPYLLQHAHNPVDWFAWGDEAFEKAKEENKPIFLSIGYSTCHWCHVMERESFEDEEVAAMLNEHFIAIKVDREERPDVDHIYMTVCQAMTGRGGWPLTIFMTPDKKPFFAGTYYPKTSRRGMPGLMDIFSQVVDKWENEHEKILESSNQIEEAVKPRFNQFVQEHVSEESLHKAYQQLEKNFDQVYGGFYQAPKFPTPHQYMFLLRYYKKTKSKEALQMVVKTLESMYRGGIYDHIGFGFARYSTDNSWLVPHFEKMLYDNALLAYTYLELYQVTKDTKYAEIAESIFTYVMRDMQDKQGGFYSAEDADSEGVEGKFYLWDKEEVLSILGEQTGELYCHVYDITEGGNFEGRNIPNLIDIQLEPVAEDYGMTLDELKETIDTARKKLFLEREKRIHPHKDDKILTSWNGLIIAAFAKGAQVLNKPEYSEAAEKAIQFVLNQLVSDTGRLLARYRDGEAKYLGYVDDYAFFIWGLIEQYEATYQTDYLKEALKLNEQLKELFWDKEKGGYFFYGRDAEDLLARPKEIYDGAMPSGNSVAALNILRLARITGNIELEEEAKKQLEAFAGSVKLHPSAYTYFLNASYFYLEQSKEIVIVGNEQDKGTMEMRDLLRGTFLPEAVVLFRTDDNADVLGEVAPFTKDQKKLENKATAYVCENFACHAPTTSLEVFKKLIVSE